MYKSYQHIEKLSNTDEVEGILDGTVYVQPKIDGTNCVIWYEDDEVHVGCRTRELSLNDNNQHCFEYVKNNENLCNLARFLKDYYIYGEYLIRNKISYYLKPMYKKVFVFDIQSKIDGHYMTYEEIKEVCEKYNVIYIPTLARLEKPTIEELMPYLQNDYLLDKDNPNCNCAEGIIIKNYNYKNKYGEIIWAKIVNSDFKQKARQKKVIVENQFEIDIIEKYLTEDIIDKVYYKLIADNDNKWNSKLIYKFLGMIFHDFVNECIWQIIKDKRRPTINFKILEIECYNHIKTMRKDLF